MNLTIDNKTVRLSKQVSILEAADMNGIYIPRMCAHPELEPYGGCRLCIVEIEGKKGYPTACTTEVEEGMVIRTNTNMLQKMRLDILQLILSEHPAACLLCEDIEGCSMFQETIRKVGVTTGCRWCPKDKDCELQRVVESFNIHELSLPGLYRDLPVEKLDPFFDRDYNLCIYCGRCVRICNEYRLSSVISLKQRGKHTTIGPSFDSNHTDAGCEYCGACVSVCPTGAMSEKSRKWWGIPDTYTKSLCPLCSINCEIQAISLRDKIVGTIPSGIPHEAAGELCVKGRFCLSELVNRTERILEPQYLFPEGEGIINWKEALKKGGDIMTNLSEDRTALFVSPDLSTEEFIAISEFAEKVLKTKFIGSSCFDNKMIAYQELALNSIPITSIPENRVLVSLFLNGNYNYGPLTLAIKKMAASGVPYFQIGWIRDTTTRFASEFISPAPGDEVSNLDQIIEYLENRTCRNEQLKRIADMLLVNNDTLIVAGPWILSLSNCEMVLERINRILKLSGSKLYMPDPYGNMKSILSTLKLIPLESILEKIDKGMTDLVYIIGDQPFSDNPRKGKIIYQSAFPFPESLNPDLVLPSTIWSESTGTWQGINGSPIRIKKVAKAHDYALTNIDILGKLAVAAGMKDVKASIKKKITAKPAFLKPELPLRSVVSAEKVSSATNRKKPFVFIFEKSPHNYMNMNLDEALEGLHELVSPDQLLVNSRDAEELKLSNGDIASISSDNAELNFPVKLKKNVPSGYLYMISKNIVEGFITNPCYVKIRRAHV